MANYFNTLNLRQQLAQLGKCRFMGRDEFADGASYLQGKKVVMSAIAMAFVMGGSIFKIDEAEKSGAWGGFMVGVIFFITTLILFANSDKTARSDVPMLAIAKEVNPIFATTLRLCDFWFDFQYRL